MKCGKNNFICQLGHSISTKTSKSNHKDKKTPKD